MTRRIIVSPKSPKSPERVEITLPDGGRAVVTVSADVPLAAGGDPWLPLLLPIAMRTRSDLHIEAPVDEVLMRGAVQAQRLMHKGFLDFTRVRVTAPSAPVATTAAPGTACFFSGGVDSFYSALTANARITHLVFVHGFDIAYVDEGLARRALADVRAVAASLGRPLIVVRTDLRAVTDRYVDWGRHFYGAGLAVVAHLLRDQVSTVLVPGSLAEPDVPRSGSQTRLQQLWSSSGVAVVNHGLEANRAQKIMRISEAPAAMAHLRVCWRNENGAYNCGRCEKCLRTMVGLRVAGALDRCATLPHDLPLQRVARLPQDRVTVQFTRENLEELRASGRDPDLARALEASLRRSRVPVIVRHGRSVAADVVRAVQHASSRR